jgi:hypothetical protein
MNYLFTNSFEDLDQEKAYVSGWGFLMDKKCTTVGQGPAIYTVCLILKFEILISFQKYSGFKLHSINLIDQIVKF